GGAFSTIGFKQFNSGLRGIGKCTSEDITQEHIAFRSTHHLTASTQRLQYIKALIEREDDAFLRGTHHVSQAVAIKIQVAQLRSKIPVLINSLSSIAEGMEDQAIAAYRDVCRQCIQLHVGNILTCGTQSLPQPAVQTAGSVYTDQNAVARLVVTVGHMQKGVDP